MIVCEEAIEAKVEIQAVWKTKGLAASLGGNHLRGVAVWLIVPLARKGWSLLAKKDEVIAVQRVGWWDYGVMDDASPGLLIRPSPLPPGEAIEES